MTVQTLPPGGGRRFGPGISVKVGHGASEHFTVFESELPPAWDGPPPHVHDVYDEAFYVLDGTVAFSSCDGEVRDCPVGSFVFVPRGAAHGFGNRRDDPARVLIITSPGALRLVEGIYALGGDPSGAVDPAAMAALWTEHRSRVVGPVRPGGAR